MFGFNYGVAGASGGGVSWSSWSGATNGSSLAFFTGSIAANSISMCLIGTNKVVVTYKDASDNSTYVICGTISSKVITWGTALQLDSGGGNWGKFSLSYIATDKALLTYIIPSSALKAVIITTSGTTVTANTAITVGTDADSQTQGCATLSSTALMVAWSSNGGYLKSQVVSLSGTTLSTVGNAVATIETDSVSFANASIIGCDSTHAVIAYSLPLSTTMSAKCLSVSGTTITGNTRLDISTAVTVDANNRTSITRDSSTGNMVVVYGTTSGTPAGTNAVALSLSGTTLTKGALLQVGSSTSESGQSVSYITGSYYMVTYSGTTSPTGRVLSLSGTTLTMPGSAVVIEVATANGNYTIPTVTLDASNVICAYHNSTTNGKGIVLNQV